MASFKKRYDEFMNQIKTSNTNSSQNLKTNTNTNYSNRQNSSPSFAEQVISGEYNKQYQKQQEELKARIIAEQEKRRQQEEERKRQENERKRQEEERKRQEFKQKKEQQERKPKTNNSINNQNVGQQVKNNIFKTNEQMKQEIEQSKITKKQIEEYAKKNNPEFKTDKEKNIMSVKDALSTGQIKKYNPDEEKLKAGEDIITAGKNTALGVEKGFVNASRAIVRGVQQDFGDGSPIYSAGATVADIIDESGKTGKEIMNEPGLEVDKITGNVIDKLTSAKGSINEKIKKNVNNTNTKIGRKVAELAPSIGQMLPSMAVTALQPEVGAFLASETASDDYYDDALARGMNEQDANTYAGVMGIVEGLTEKIQVGKVVKLGKNTASSTATKSLLKEFGLDMTENAIQEAITEPISEIAAQAIGGKDSADWENITGRMIQSGIDGALSAVIVNGASVGIGSAVKVKNKLDNGQSVTQTEIKQVMKDIQDSGKVDIEQVIKEEIASQTEKLNEYNKNQQIQSNQQTLNELNEQVLRQEQMKPQDFKEQQIVEDTLNEMYKERSKLQQELEQKINQNNNYQYKPSENEKINTLRRDASKLLDNSEKTQNLMDTIEKVIEDKDYSVRFNDTITNENGQQVNAKIQTLSNGQTEITINPNSNRSAEILLTHEITHAIETDAMKKLVNDYASKNKEFAGNLQSLKETYGVDDVSDEVLADISGQLLGNQEFINEISMQKPSTFKRIYNAIVSLANKLTGNKIENLFIKDLKNKWEKAYRESNKQVNETKFSISKLSNGEDTVLSDDINGSNPSNKIVEETLKKLIGVKFNNESSSSQISIENKDIKKFLHDGYNNYKNMQLKKRISGNYGEILEIAKLQPDQSKANYKGTNRGNLGFDYYNINLSYPIKNANNEIIDYKTYDARLVVRKEENGNFAYDLDNFTKKEGITVDKSNSSIVAEKSADDTLTNNSISDYSQNINNNLDEKMGYSQQNSEWQDFLERNFKERGTTTQFKDILQKNNKDIQTALLNEIESIVAPIQESMQNFTERVDSLTKMQAPLMSGLTEAEVNEKNIYDYFVENNGYDKLDEHSKKRYDYLQSQVQNETSNVLEDNIEVPFVDRSINKYNDNYKTYTDEEIDYEVSQQNAPYNEKIDNTVDIINDALNQVKYSLNTDLEEDDYTPLSKNPKLQNKLENQGDTISDTINRISAKRTKEKIPFSKVKNDFAQAIINKAHYVDKLAKETKNPQLKYAYDRMLGSFSEGQYCIGNEQVNSKGEVTGKSIMNIFKPAIKSKLYNEFNDYLFHKHNIDRQAVNKAVFGKEFTAENSKRIISQYNEKYPQFKEWSREVYRFNKNNLKEMLDEGFISKSTYDNLKAMYGSYVPTFRDIADTITDDNNSVTFDFTGNDKNKEKKVGYSPLKKAKGGNQALLAVDEAMAEHIIMQKRAIRMNQTLKELYNALSKSDKNQIAQKPVPTGDITAVTLLTSSPENFVQKTDNGNYVAMFYENGEIKSFSIPEEIYKAFEPSKAEELVNSCAFTKATGNVLKKVTDFRRNLLTTYSIGFAFNNPIKDIQEAVFNTKYSTAKFALNYSRALFEMATGGKYYKDYLRQGGGANTYFEYDTGLKKPNKVVKGLTAPIKAINMLNEVIERAPRLAEYITTMQETGNVNEALYNSAELTTNFKRGGDITKAFNRYGINFLNASVQGMDKIWRNLKGENGAKGYAQLVTRASILAIAPALINALVYKDDKDYDDLPDYIKNGYWLFKTGDGKFARIPQGRVISSIATTAREMLNVGTGKKDSKSAFVNLYKNTVEQLAPNNPLDNNIFSPIKQVINNKSWYGEDIVGTRLQKLPEAEQSDERTDEFSKFLGEQLNISPKKINYLIDQYSGGFGDVILPKLTPYAENNILEDKFTTDSVMKNKHVSEFYDFLEEMEKQKNSKYATDEDKKHYDDLQNYMYEMAGYYKEKRNIESSTELTDKEKREQAREVQKKINETAEQGLATQGNTSGNVARIGENNYYKDSEGNWKKETESKKAQTSGMSEREKSKYTSVVNKTSSIDKEYTEKSKILKKKYDEDSDIYKEKSAQLANEKKQKTLNSIINSNLSSESKYKAYGATDAGRNDSHYEDAMKLKINADTYLQYKKQTFTADKDKNGKTISGSKKDKVFEYVNSMNISKGQKAVLMKLNGYNYNDNKSENYARETINYIDSLSISTKEKQKLLKHLNYKIKADGTISW